MHSYVVVDAFSTEPLAGNPVAVFRDAADLSADRMQQVAREMNLSEVTFELPPRAGGDARIRIFTPVNELPFAGHPLLGTAVALGGSVRGDVLRLETAMGVVPFDLTRQRGRVVEAWMRQPSPVWRSYEHADELLAAVGVESSTLPVEAYHNGPNHVFVGLDDVEALSRVAPDHRALGCFPDMAVNCFAGAATQWRVRMFSPAYGVVEDAATGSAAGPLAVHLARYRVVEFGQEIEILQGVEIARPSLMRARAEGRGEQVDAVHVGGAGVVVARGVIYV